ncbi:MAG: class I SAM-dependent methyltransferase [Actinomycetota bacterium]|nr:class I SAM-dependent methyltransferase [Actinomycetota bacterium]
MSRLVEACAACGSRSLVPYRKVKGETGADGLAPTNKQFGTALGDIVRCTECTHQQLDRFPDEDELAAAYEEAASDDYVEEEAGQRASFAAVLERVERHVSKGRILDIGCWVGFLLAEARDRGWSEGVGVEPSSFASAYARERLGLDVRQEDLLDADLPLAHFDAVCMGDVLEHLTDTDKALTRMRELLAPGGVLVLAVPDAGSRIAKILGKRWWSVIPTHIHYFTRQSLTTMLERAGFEVLDAATDPKSFTIEYYLDKGSGYLPGVSKALVRAARKLKVADRMWTPDFRDRLLVIARPT